MTGNPATSSPTTHPTCVLVGNPNCGKTTIFNALTGLRHKVSNYPGVTVERKEGICFSPRGDRIKLIDLPGAYSLNARSPDEAILRDILLGRRSDTLRPDRVLCVLDASNLERNLYLATQIIELGIPTIIIVNMIDLAENQRLKIDFAALQKLLGCPVIPLQANTKKGLVELKFALAQEHLPPPAPIEIRLPSELNEALSDACRQLEPPADESPGLTRSWDPGTFCLLSQGENESLGINEELTGKLTRLRRELEAQIPNWEEQTISARYRWIRKGCRSAVRHPETQQTTLTDRLDAVFLHPLWGWLTVVFCLSVLFYLIFSIADGPMSWIETRFSAAGQAVEATLPAGDLRDLIVDGVIAGIGGVVIFLPQILILFFFIGLMEDTGYMARLAFIMDRLMSRVGLNGKSFLPLLSSYACAVPGVMATRTIENPKDRLITILVLPLASCSARLPVYLLMIAAMIPAEQVSAFVKAGIMVSMYLLGTFGAFVFAWVFNRSIAKRESTSMVLELPSYKTPSFRKIFLFLWERTGIFVRRAGTIILGISILLWAASNYPKSDSPDNAVQLQHSVAGQVGQVIEPLIAPLGYDWKIGIGLLASFAAREVFVSTMTIVYQVESEDEDEIRVLRDRLLTETKPDGSLRYTPLVCLSLMVFYVFAMQCMSTLAIVKRETNSWKWPLFQLGYLTLAAYAAALAVFQVGSLLGY